MSDKIIFVCLEWENEKLEQNRELEMKCFFLLIGLGFKLGFVPIFHFSGFSLRIQAGLTLQENILKGASCLNSHRLPNICRRILHS